MRFWTSDDGTDDAVTDVLRNGRFDDLVFVEPTDEELTVSDIAGATPGVAAVRQGDTGRLPSPVERRGSTATPPREATGRGTGRRQMRFLQAVRRRSIAAGVVLGAVALGVGVVGPTAPANADLPSPWWYCGAFKPHTGDILTHAELDHMGPGLVVFYCEAYHFTSGGQDWHCYNVIHIDGIDPDDPADDYITWRPNPGSQCPVYG